MSRSKSKRRKLMMLLPNMVTLASLCIGLTAIRFAMEEDILRAASLLLLAGFLDGVDGRLARFLNCSSEFGAQLDSLIDFVNFGVVPGFIIYVWVNAMTDIYGLDWALVLFFAGCMALRLARFNVALDKKIANKTLDKYFFQGIPAPCAAAMAMLPLVLSFQFGEDYFFANPIIVLFYVFGLAIIAISTTPTISIKKIPIKNRNTSLTLVILGLIAFGLIFEPWLTLAAIGITYLFSIPVTIFYYFKIKYC